MSRNKGAAAAKANYTQQGLIHTLNEVEEKALEDFSKATELGSAFAKTMVVQINPCRCCHVQQNACQGNQQTERRPQ